MIAKVACKRWVGENAPRRILAIRMQALGDTMLTLPYLNGLKQQHPEMEIDFFTRKEVAAVPHSLNIFDKVIAIGGGRNARLQFVLTLLKMPLLWTRRYDVVLDLQNNRISVILRKLLLVRAWTEFDRTSPVSASERTKRTIEALGIWKVNPFREFNHIETDELLVRHGWDRKNSLVVLNPAGAFPSRNWPLQNYISFAIRWLAEVNTKTQFVLLLTEAKRDAAREIATALGAHCIDLTGRANQVEAFSILKKARLVLSEDSGLMHMAWIQRVPTLALFSSSRPEWSAPEGEWSRCLDSSDLPCGACLLAVCKFGDNRCLNRYTPEIVVREARALLTFQDTPQFR